MGIKGLMTYMVDDKYSMKAHKLRKTRVIIDGNNLLHSIHHAHNLVWKFGGEYESFDKGLAKFFERLKLCELDPFVIFDGCYDSEASKFYTTISRFKDRLHTCFKLNKEFNSAGYLLPMLAIQTIIPVLQRLNISFITCNEEADREAAALANYFNCPIVSNDSDFFIFPLNYGFIPVGCLNFIPVEENCECCSSKTHYYLPCSLFQQSNFRLKSSNNLSVNKIFMPLFSTLMGNDLVSIDFFDVIFLQNMHSRKSKNIKKSSKVVSFLTWLHQFDSVESAVDKILASLKECERDKIQRKINVSLAQYDISESQLVELVNSKQSALNKGHDIFSRLPLFVNIRLCKSILSPIFMNCLLSGNVFLSTYAELIKANSIHTISTPLREKFYRILSGFVDQKSKTICEYSRRGSSVCKRVVNIDENDSELISGLSSINNEFSFIKFMICYWVKMVDKSRVCYRSVLAVIVAISIQLSWQHELARPESNFNKDRYNHLAYKFYKDPIVSNLHRFQIEFVHSFNELQSIYFSMVQLLCLDEHFPTESIPSPQSLFCGKLSYNLSQDLKKRRNCWNYVRHIFDLFPCNNFQKEFVEIIHEVETVWPEFENFIKQSNDGIDIVLE